MPHRKESKLARSLLGDLAWDSPAVFTIGFTKTTAANFFERLSSANVRRVIDVRLHNTSQLSGFAKAEDLRYFLAQLLNIEYVHEPLLAPTDEILAPYKKKAIDWKTYELGFLDLLEKREIEKRFSADMFDHGCLLCSEAKPHHCHRRLVCNYLSARWEVPLSVTHL